MVELEEILTVFIVDDDYAIRDSLSLLLGLRGFKTLVFDSADSFLAAATAHGSGKWAGCVLADMGMPGTSGLDLLVRAHDMKIAMPIVIMSAYGDVASVRQAFLRSAVDFLPKPFGEEELLSVIEKSFDLERRRLRSTMRHHQRGVRTDSLTERERQICELMTKGLSNHEIAAKLGISHRTAQVHRGHVMQKMQTASLAELIAVCKDD